MKTKRILFALLLLLSTWVISFGQSEDRWSIGPRGGVNFATVTNVDNVESITGAVLGLTTTYSLNENSGITFDALYSVEGFQAPLNEYRMRYLQIPIYYDFFFGELGNRFRPKIYVGVAPEFYLSGTVNELNNNDDYFNKFMVGATGGLGFNYRVGSRIWLNTDLRSFIGLSDVRAKDFAEGDNINPRLIQLSLGLCYGFDKLD
jgi:outer membrane protein W